MITPYFFVSLGFIVLVFIIFKYIFPVFSWGAIFFPTKQKTVERMIVLAEVKPGERAVDLGSGDGRLVIAMAKAGAEAHGYEINPVLAWISQKRIMKAGLEQRAFIHQGSYWQENLSHFDIVTVYGMDYMMKKLEAKLKNDLHTNARIVSNSFPFPTWPYYKKDNRVYVYKKQRGF